MDHHLPNLPATNLADAFNACDPASPLDAGDPRYVDLTPGRGEEGSAVAQCRKRILRSSSPLVQLFAGHRGCGKSTELRRLQHTLEEDGYFVAFFKAEQSLDLEDIVRRAPEDVDEATHPLALDLDVDADQVGDVVLIGAFQGGELAPREQELLTGQRRRPLTVSRL